MNMLGTYLTFFFFIVGARASAEQLPPLGQRVYILDSRKPSRPAEIRSLQDADAADQTVMRDPLPFSSQSYVEKKRPKGKAPEAPKRISRMVFDKVPVQGRYLVPRVRFDRPTLSIGHQEEPVNVEYRRKILESERDLHEFDW